jgi:hypothetical protein
MSLTQRCDSGKPNEYAVTTTGLRTKGGEATPLDEGDVHYESDSVSDAAYAMAHWFACHDDHSHRQRNCFRFADA